MIASGQEALYKCISGILKNKKCHLFRINGIEDHLHIVTDIHPSVSLANLMKDIKLGSTDYIKKSGIFPSFNGWQNGYGAFTYSIEAKDNLIAYVKNQKQHHNKRNFKDEYKRLLEKYDVKFDEKYLF